MVYRGKIQNGVVIFEGNTLPPEGTLVEVHAIKSETAELADDPIFNIGQYAVSTGIPDLARNIDHYLYGHPKKDHASE
jgi:hypothetical protein